VFEQSESVGAIAKAMAKVQATVEGASKGKVNPAFKSKYADLSSVWEACREPLSANGLAIVQFPGEMVENRMTMTTQLLHESGEWMRATLSIPLSKVDAQGYGSCVTYARRYALAAVVGICPEDDDGNAASAGRSARNDASPATIDDGQRALLTTLSHQAGADMKAFCTFYKIGSLPELPADKFAHAKAMLDKKLADKFTQQEAAA
jgi:hypothetical protein